jgi:hypothetical protein
MALQFLLLQLENLKNVPPNEICKKILLWQIKLSKLE